MRGAATAAERKPEKGKKIKTKTRTHNKLIGKHDAIFGAFKNESKTTAHSIPANDVFDCVFFSLFLSLVQLFWSIILFELSQE